MRCPDIGHLLESESVDNSLHHSVPLSTVSTYFRTRLPFLYLGEYARRYNRDFFRFIDDVDEAIVATAYLPNAGADSESIDPDLRHAVHLMTALRAKGKEFKTVVILDANDGMWPIRLAETQAELEQERRIFYVGITRARGRLFLLSVERLAGRLVPVTPYLSEMGIAG